MKFVILIGILAVVAALSLALVVGLYRHKKRSLSGDKVVGKLGRVSSDLMPEGAVLVHGELWRARSRSGSPVLAQTPIRVVGVEGHLLLVEACE
jgi:membrane-bound serine protease (ClpP class)